MNNSFLHLKENYGVVVNGSEVGFPPTKIFDVINWYRENRLAIYGGDVYMKQGGRYVPSYDNWYFNKEDAKKDYLNESIDCAENYIKNYPMKDDILFVLIPN